MARSKWKTSLILAGVLVALALVLIVGSSAIRRAAQGSSHVRRLEGTEHKPEVENEAPVLPDVEQERRREAIEVSVESVVWAARSLVDSVKKVGVLDPLREDTIDTEQWTEEEIDHAERVIRLASRRGWTKAKRNEVLADRLMAKCHVVRSLSVCAAKMDRILKDDPDVLNRTSAIAQAEHAEEAKKAKQSVPKPKPQIPKPQVRRQEPRQVRWWPAFCGDEPQRWLTPRSRSGLHQRSLRLWPYHPPVYIYFRNGLPTNLDRDGHLIAEGALQNRGKKTWAWIRLKITVGDRRRNKIVRTFMMHDFDPEDGNRWFRIDMGDHAPARSIAWCKIQWEDGEKED